MIPPPPPRSAPPGPPPGLRPGRSPRCGWEWAEGTGAGFRCLTPSTSTATPNPPCASPATGCSEGSSDRGCSARVSHRHEDRKPHRTDSSKELHVELPLLRTGPRSLTSCLCLHFHSSCLTPPLCPFSQTAGSTATAAVSLWSPGPARARGAGPTGTVRPGSPRVRILVLLKRL